MIVIDIARTAGSVVTSDKVDYLHRQIMRHEAADQIVLDFSTVRSVTVDFVNSLFTKFDKSFFKKLDILGLDSIREQQIRTIAQSLPA